MKVKGIGKNNIMWFVIATFFGVYCILCALLQNISWCYAFSFIFYELFGIVSIGFSVLNLIKLKPVNWIETVGLSYASGYAVNILVYICSFAFLGALGFKILIFLLIIGSIIYNFRIIKQHRYVLLPSTDKRFILIILIIILGFQFFLFAANNCSTAHLGVNSYYVDLVYWSSDAVTFTKQFPPINFRDIGSDGKYYYHYFSAIQVAISSMITGIPVINFVLGFSYIQSAFFLVFGTYIFFHELVDSRFFIYMGMALFLFTTGKELYSWVTAASHMFTAPFGFDIGTIIGMLSVTMFIRQIREKRINKAYFSLVTLFFAVCMGVKSPVACIVLVIFGCSCFYLLVKKDKECVITAFTYGIVLVALSVLIFLFFTNGMMTGESKAEQFISGGTNKSILNQPEVHMVNAIIKTQFSKISGEILFLVYYIILVNPAVFLCGLLGGMIHLCKVKRIEYVDVEFAIATIIGILLTRLLKLIGFSQMYFIMATFPYMTAFGMRGFNNYYKSMREGESGIFWSTGIKAVSIIFLGIGVWLFVNSMYFLPQMTSGYKKILTIFNRYEAEDIYLGSSNGRVECKEIDDKSQQDYLVIGNSEVNVAEWIRNNTDKGCIIAADLLETKAYGYNYMIGVIAERWIWIEDKSVISNVIAGDEVAKEILVKSGVQYLAINKDNVKDSEADGVVYSNDSVCIIDITYD